MNEKMNIPNTQSIELQLHEKIDTLLRSEEIRYLHEGVKVV